MMPAERGCPEKKEKRQGDTSLDSLRDAGIDGIIHVILLFLF
jgi:hypothetical protein